MDKNRVVANGNGRKSHSSTKNPPPPPPKPSYAKNGGHGHRNSNSNGHVHRDREREREHHHHHRRGSQTSLLPLPSPHSHALAVAASSSARRSNNGISHQPNGRRSHSRSHSHSGESVGSRNAGIRDDYMGSSSITGNEDDGDSVKSRSLMGNGVKRVTPKSSSESWGHRRSSEQKIELDEKDDDGCCLSPKQLLTLKVNPFCARMSPYLLPLIINIIGVFVGAVVTYATLQMGNSLSSSSPSSSYPVMPVSIKSYRPIENYAVSPVSGIRSENLHQPWITIDLNPIIIGVQQLSSSGADEHTGEGEGGQGEVFGVESISLVFNVTHSQFNQTSASATSNSTETGRTHLITFRIKSQLPADNDQQQQQHVPEFQYLNSVTENPSAASDEDLLITVQHEQIGNEDQFEAFIPLAENVQEKVTHLFLKYVVISPQQLLESLKYAKKLRVLELDQVQLLGYFDGRAQLPALTKFSLHVVNSSNLIADSAPIKTYLFFDKNGYWRIEKVTSLGVDIDLAFDGRKYLGINRSKGQLVSQLLMTNTILEHLYLNDRAFQLLDLGLSFVEVDNQLVSTAIEHLSLSSVTFKYGQSLEQLLRRLENLRTLELNNASSLALKASDLPSSTLKHLAYGHSTLKYSPDVFLNLDSLYLDNVEGDEHLFHKFNLLFNVSRIAVSGLPASILPHSFLKKILQMSAVHWIYLENFDRADIVAKNTTAHSDYTEIEWFLISAGVPANVEVFLLEKNATSGTWNGNGVTIKQHKHLWFDLFGMEKFWTRASVDILNGMKGQKYITYYLSKQKDELDELTTMEQ